MTTYRNMDVLLIPLFALVACIWPAAANAQTVYAVFDSINVDCSADSGPWAAGNSHGFEFTPSKTYAFDRIEKKFSSTRQFDVSVVVYDGRNGPVVATASALPSVAFKWIAFDLDEPVTFTEGQTYFIAVEPPSINDSLPGTVVGGPTSLQWWYAPPGSSDYSVSFGPQSPGFRFLLEVPCLFSDDFETGDLSAWTGALP